jgi:biotin synthase
VKPDSAIAEAARQALSAEPLSRDLALALCRTPAEGVLELISAAWRVRRAVFGRRVVFCGIASVKTGGCSEDCRWCAQSAHHSGAHAQPSQRPDDQDLIRAARDSAKAGASSFGLVSSGRAPAPDDLDRLEPPARAVADKAPLTLCASLGELSAEQARRLVDMGVRRYNHNLETSRRHFARVVGTHDYDSRLRTLQVARAAGMELCCGGLFGLGETWEDRVDLALTLRDQVGPTVTPLNFLHPIEGTPLADAAPLTPVECLTIIAVFRLILPTVDLKIAGGRGVNLREMQSWIFHAGATSCLVGNYLTTLGRSVQQDIEMVRDAGLELVDRLAPQPIDPGETTDPSCATST